MSVTLKTVVRQAHGETRGQMVAFQPESFPNVVAAYQRIAEMANNVKGEGYTARKVRESIAFHVVDHNKPKNRHWLRRSLSPRYQRLDYIDAQSLALALQRADRRSTGMLARLLPFVG